MRRLVERLARLGAPLGSGLPGTSPSRMVSEEESTYGLRLPTNARDDALARLREMIRACGAAPRPKLTSLRPAVAIGGTDAVRLPGRRVDTEAGPLRYTEHVLEPDHHHGRMAVSRALEVPAATLSALARDELCSEIDPQRLLFLDTETTGLSPVLAAQSHLALAKLFEHRLKAPAEALHHAQYAAAAEERAAHERRMERLARRLCRSPVRRVARPAISRGCAVVATPGPTPT